MHFTCKNEKIIYSAYISLWFAYEKKNIHAYNTISANMNRTSERWQYLSFSETSTRNKPWLLRFMIVLTTYLRNIKQKQNHNGKENIYSSPWIVSWNEYKQIENDRILVTFPSIYIIHIRLLYIPSYTQMLNTVIEENISINHLKEQLDRKLKVNQSE